MPGSPHPHFGIMFGILSHGPPPRSENFPETGKLSSGRPQRAEDFRLIAPSGIVCSEAVTADAKFGVVHVAVALGRASDLMREKPNSLGLKLPGGSTDGPVTIVNAIMRPLPSLSAKPPLELSRRANRFHRRHSASEITPRSPRLQPIARTARTTGGESELSSLVSLSSDWAHGVLYTDGRSFTLRQNLLRQPELLRHAHKPRLLPALLPSTKPPSPDSVQTSSLDEPASPSSPQSPGTPAMVSNAGYMERPGEGINASPAKLVVADSWGLVKKNMLGMAARARRASAERDFNSFQLKNASPNAPVPCMVNPGKILTMLSSIPWFKSQSNRTLQKMLGTGSLIFFPRGSLIIRESSYGSCFYVLLNGLVGVSSTSKRIDVRMDTAGAFFGEAALASDVHVRREASVIALEDVWCFRLTADHMRELKVSPEL